MTTTLHISPAETVSETQVRVGVAVDLDGRRLAGSTTVTRSGDRVWAETVIDGVTVLCGKLDPNEEDNSYAVVSAEIRRITEISLPLATGDAEAAACVAHAIVVSARPEWG